MIIWSIICFLEVTEVIKMRKYIFIKLVYLGNKFYGIYKELGIVNLFGGKEFGNYFFRV